MRYDVASALADKSRFEGGRNAQSLKYATELSKTLHFDTEIHVIESNIFGKCLRVTSREGIALDFFPEKDLVVASSSDFTASYNAGQDGDRMVVAVKNADGLYIKELDIKHGESVVSVESSFWAQDTLEYIASKDNPLSRTTLKVDTEKAAYDHASQTVAAPLSKKGFTQDYDSDEFGTFIEEHEKAEAEEKSRLDSIFATNNFDSIPGLAKDLNILPDEEAKYEEEGTINPEVAAQIAMTAINTPENMVATIKEGFNRSSGYTA